mgnify:CR=1 FL=1
MDKNKIKNQKLKTLIEDSFKFNSLPEKKQQEILNKIINSSDEEQEKIYIPFFERENQEENEIVAKREEALQNLVYKAMETRNYIVRTVAAHKENTDKASDKKAEQSLLDQLKNI